jgi:hypothetical protein
VWGVGETSDAEYLVPAGMACRVEASKDGFETAACELRVTEAGATVERTLWMTPRKDLGDLWIEFASTGSIDIARAGFGMFATQTSNAHNSSLTLRIAAHMGPTARTPDIVRDETTHDGTFRLIGIPAGGYDLVAIPGSTWMEADGYWSHEPVHVDVTPGGVARVRIDLRAAGRLRLRCDNRRGVHLPARCEVSDASGASIATSLFRWDAKRNSFWGGGDSLNVGAPDGANDVYPNLSPGTYQVRFSLDGYVETTRTVRVEPAATTEVAVVLEDR